MKLIKDCKVEVWLTGFDKVCCLVYLQETLKEKKKESLSFSTGSRTEESSNPHTLYKCWFGGTWGTWLQFHGVHYSIKGLGISQCLCDTFQVRNPFEREDKLFTLGIWEGEGKRHRWGGSDVCAPFLCSEEHNKRQLFLAMDWHCITRYSVSTW